MLLCMVLMFAAISEVSSATNHDTSAQGDAEFSPTENDCGIRALFLLLRAMDIDTSFEDIRTALPPPSFEGYSIAELREASRKLGLSLRVERLDPKSYGIGQPMIAYLEQPSGGHFVFIRPLGKSDRIIQVLEYPFAPKIMDLDYFISHTGWSGIATIPRSGRTMPLLAIIALVLVMGMAVGLLLLGKLKGRGKLKGTF